VIDFDSREKAQAWLDDAPFTKGGVFGKSTIYPYMQNWPRKPAAD